MRQTLIARATALGLAGLGMAGLAGNAVAAPVVDQEFFVPANNTTINGLQSANGFFDWAQTFTVSQAGPLLSLGLGLSANLINGADTATISLREGLNGPTLLTASQIVSFMSLDQIVPFDVASMGISLMPGTVYALVLNSVGALEGQASWRGRSTSDPVNAPLYAGGDAYQRIPPNAPWQYILSQSQPGFSDFLFNVVLDVKSAPAPASAPASGLLLASAAAAALLTRRRGSRRLEA